MTATHLLELTARRLTALEIPRDDPWRVREVPVVWRARRRLCFALEQSEGLTDVGEDASDGGPDSQPATAEASVEARPGLGSRRLTRRELAEGGDVLRGSEPTVQERYSGRGTPS